MSQKISPQHIFDMQQESLKKEKKKEKRNYSILVHKN